MKRSGMDVDVISDAQTLPIYSVSAIHVGPGASISLSTVGDKCAKDNCGVDFIKSLTNFNYTKIHIIIAVK